MDVSEWWKNIESTLFYHPGATFTKKVELSLEHR